MSAAPRFPRDIGYAGLRMSADEFLALGETAERYELIDGVVVMSPSPNSAHSEVAAEVTYQLKAHARSRPGVRVFPENDLRLSPTCVYRPDVSVYGPGRLPKDVGPLLAPPDLIIEFLSAGTKGTDLITKRDDYERFGVGEYWAIDPSDARLRCWVRRGVQLIEQPVEGDHHASAALEGFTLDIRAIRAFARPL